MRPIIKLSAILVTILLFNNTTAAENITGTWQGKLVVTPETELKIQFIINQDDDGSYTVVLNSPDQGAIKDIEANSVVYDSGNLKLDVAELSGAYEGVVTDGKLEGNWIQEGTSMPLNLIPYVKPTLTREDKEKLLGSWNGPLNFPGGSITAVYRFEMTEDGGILGFAESPDQGAFNTPVTDMEMENGILTIKVEAWQTEFKGRMEGDEIIGEFKQRGQALPLALKRGEYKIKGINLDLAEQDMATLVGEWNGPLITPTGSLTVVFRFEKTKEGTFVAFHDSPDQGAKGVSVTEATVNNGELTLKMETINAQFTGKLTGDEIIGEWKQRSGSLPLTLKKGEYKAPVFSLNLSKEAMDQLSGKWQGKLGPLTLVFRFGKTDKGDFVGFIDSPNQGTKGVPIKEAALSDGQIELKFPTVGGEYTGQLTGDSLVGEWKQGGQSNPLTLTKE